MVKSEGQQQLSLYDDIQCKFHKACSQVILLNNWIQAAQIRYNRALRDNNRAFRYVHRLRLMTLEGTRNMIFEYASRKAEDLDIMQDSLVAQGLLEADDDDSDDEQDEEEEQEDEAVQPPSLF